MYEVDEHDRVIGLDQVPQSSVGSPLPILLAGENSVSLAYYLEDTPRNGDGPSAKVASADNEGEPVAVVAFEPCLAHMFGPPNDETISGHPLGGRGLGPYGVFQIENSSWLRKLEEMNSVHPYHDRERFLAKWKHFIFSFHDTTFECIAEGFEVDVAQGSLENMIPRMLKSIRLSVISAPM
jgi:hypothetical protein